jgi:hypothetical protein
MFVAEGFGGSGKTLIRAVSLPGGVVDAAGFRVGGVTLLGAAAVPAVPMGRGTGVLATGCGGGAVVAGGGGGGTVRVDAGTPPTGALADGFCATGGRGIVKFPGLGATGAKDCAG